MNTLKKYLPAGTLLADGKYKVIKKRAAGGFGCAYVVECVPTGEIMAIKELFVHSAFLRRDDGSVYTTEVSDEWVESVKKKFIEEANILMSLDHPNIVKVKELFPDNNTLYYVMDYIEGATLYTLVSRTGPVRDKVAVKYISQIANALKYLHENKCLHLDVKPSNIMIDREGNAILIDFGICIDYDDSVGEDNISLLGICTSYSPIEMFHHDISMLRPTSDIYSLAATLYFMVSGQRPPQAVELKMDKKLNLQGDNISSQTRKAILQGMNVDCKQRPQDIDEFTDLLIGKSRVVDETANSPSPANNNTVHQSQSVSENAPVTESDSASVPESESMSDSKPGSLKYYLIILISLIIAVVLLLMF